MKDNLPADNDELEKKKRRAAHTALSSAALLSSMVDNDLRQYNLDSTSIEIPLKQNRSRNGSVPSILTRISRALSNSSLGHSSQSSTSGSTTHSHSSVPYTVQLPSVSTNANEFSPSRLRVLLVEDSTVVQKVRAHVYNDDQNFISFFHFSFFAFFTLLL